MTKNIPFMKNCHAQNGIICLTEHLLQTILWIAVSFYLVSNLFQNAYIRPQQRKDLYYPSLFCDLGRVSLAVSYPAFHCGFGRVVVNYCYTSLFGTKGLLSDIIIR